MKRKSIHLFSLILGSMVPFSAQAICKDVHKPDATLIKRFESKNKQNYFDCENYNLLKVSPGQPQDVTTTYIKNPTPTTNGNGWSLTASGSFNSKDNVSGFYMKPGAKMFQTIKNLPAGVYELQVQALTRTEMEAYIALGDTKEKIVTVPDTEINSHTQAAKWFTEGNGINKLLYVSGTQTSPELSITADDSHGDHWLVWRGFTLLNLGNDGSAYTYAAKKAIDGWEDEIKDKIYTEMYAQAIRDALKSVSNAETSQKAYEMYKICLSSWQDLQTNIRYYQNLIKELEFLGEELWDTYGGYEALVEKYDEILTQTEEQNLTNEDIAKTMSELEELKQEALFAFIQDGEDVTTLLKNANFHNNDPFAYWEYNEQIGKPNYFSNCDLVTNWSKDLDLYQTVNLPKGIYRLSTRAYYRTMDISNAYQTYLIANGENRGKNEVKAYLYYGENQRDSLANLFVRTYSLEEVKAIGAIDENGNDQSDTFMKLTDKEGNIVYAPNSIYTAKAVLESDVYGKEFQMNFDFIATGKENNKLGIKASKTLEGSYTVFNAFTLTYYDASKHPEMIVRQIKRELVSLESYMTQKMDSECLNMLQQIIQEGEEAIQKNDGEYMLEIYTKIPELRSTVQESITNYKKLNEALASLNKALTIYKETAIPETYIWVKDFHDQLSKEISQGHIQTNAVTEKLAEIQRATEILTIKVSDTSNASTDNPIDFTAFIINPVFNSGNLGWKNSCQDQIQTDYYVPSNSGASMGVAYQINNDENKEKNYDIYQEISGLPQGTYHIIMQGFNRKKDAIEDAKDFQFKYATSLNKTYLLNPNDHIEKPLVQTAELYGNDHCVHLSDWISLPINSDETQILQADTIGKGMHYIYIDSISDIQKKQVYYFPADNKAAINRFMTNENKLYNNATYTKVGADGILRLGVRNMQGQENDWTVFTNFSLYYLGNDESPFPPTNIPSITNTAKIKYQIIYGVDGQPRSQLKRGINIIKSITEEGKIIIKKILIK